MIRKKKSICFGHVDQFKQKALQWAYNQQLKKDSSKKEPLLFLDSNAHKDPYSRFDALIALGQKSELSANASSAFDALQSFYNHKRDWIMGCLSYDLKNEIEDLSTTNKDEHETPDLYFFQPDKLLIIKDQYCHFHYPEAIINQALVDFNHITAQAIEIDSHSVGVSIKKSLEREDYLTAVDHVLKHIQQGDVYEMNFCQRFYAEHVQIDPLAIFQKLNKLASPPFAAYLNFGEHYVLSASPERYIQKNKNQLISQPIKGTAKRMKNAVLDKEIAETLKNDPKERAENIMITDLVRNDLAKTAVKGSVYVDELCGLYSFKTVHQLISTISSQLKDDVDIADILKTTYPMGSMTGAPKVSAMQIIEKYEKTKRGIYSGAIGYITPEGDFDFNVVIRSILYNSLFNKLSLFVGSAITYQSDPQLEYEECLLKAEALLDALR